MLIRNADDCDAAAIASIHIAAWRKAYSGIVPNHILDALDVSQRTQQWAANIAAASLRTMVADTEGHIVGFASFAGTRDEDDDPLAIAEIQAIYVDPDKWGKGIGQRLCTSVIAELCTQSYSSATLWVLKDNQRACRFYKLAGFRMDGKTKTRTIGVPLQIVRYRKNLEYAM
ncbi:sortase [Rubidibacter lacunae KORDI 51-2]|uniref:Sortase n=1 Tax=Rubidibacter lacunae KORDI 51-2 TaxID=582515 RepID=U5DN34_9CHRO|nr:GNAT family N-acetyltransferase [Rubidibacter lacunae]ERN43076.1 sortase [Rubidibacter lacunae KORDI 51-2]